jgi:TIR domain
LNNQPSAAVFIVQTIHSASKTFARRKGMREIFISYRRDDTEGHAGRLFGDLTQHFGDGAVFMDVAAIEPGRDFRRAIEEQVASCSVLLAIIGKSWLTAKAESGARRLDDPMDFVRLETASALKRDIPVVPVLVQAARMPRVEDLPEDLKELAFRNGVELTHSRWDSDVQALVKSLRPYVQAKQEPTRARLQSVPSEQSPTRTGSSRMIIMVLFSVLVLAFGGYVWYQKSSEEAAREDWQGSWYLQWEYEGKWSSQKMTLRSHQSGIDGNYEIGTLEGTFAHGDFSKVTGEFINTAGTGVNCLSGNLYGKQGGSFSFTLANDGRSMDGWWNVCGEGKRWRWKADRLK